MFLRVYARTEEAGWQCTGEMSSQFCVALGLSADYGISCAEFLHTCFDQNDHYVARPTPEFYSFRDTIRALFVEQGGLLAIDAGLTASAALAARRSVSANGRFITDIACNQVATRCVFEAGDQQVITWGKCRPEEAQELRLRMGTIASTMLDRVRVEVTAVDLR